MQVSKGFAVREYALQLHISEQLAQLFRRRYSDAQVAICAPPEWALMAAPYRKNDNSEQTS